MIFFNTLVTSVKKIPYVRFKYMCRLTHMPVKLCFWNRTSGRVVEYLYTSFCSCFCAFTYRTVSPGNPNLNTLMSVNDLR